MGFQMKAEEGFHFCL